MRTLNTIRQLPWDSVLIDVCLILLWQVALEPVSVWLIKFPHVAMWLVALLQAIVVGRMVALYFRATSTSLLLGRFEYIGGLAAVLAVGSFTWLMGVMFSSDVEWGPWTQRLPVILLFVTLISLGLNLELADAERGIVTRFADFSGVILYLFFAEALLFGFLGDVERKHTLALVVALLLCHLPIRLIFALVSAKSRYDLLWAAIAFGILITSVMA